MVDVEDKNLQIKYYSRKDLTSDSHKKLKTEYLSESTIIRDVQLNQMVEKIKAFE